MLRHVLLVVVVLRALPARADCPTRSRDLPPSSFLSAVAREAFLESSASSHAPTTQTLEGNGDVVPAWTEADELSADFGVATGVRAEPGDTSATGALHGQLFARHDTLMGCVSGDVTDLRAGAAHVTASGQVPLLYSSLAIGGLYDRQVRLPLSARPELLAAPVSRAGVQFTLRFIDLTLDDNHHPLRFLVAPATVEQEFTRQDTTSRTLDRHTTRLEAEMLRIIVGDTNESGELGVFGIEDETIDSLPAGAPFTGVTRISIASFSLDRETWGLDLDGGMLSIGGTAWPQCQNVECVRGMYLAAYRWKSSRATLEARGERTGFMADNDEPAFEDRLTTTLALHDRARTLTTSLFGARTESWLDGRDVSAAGVRLAFAQSLNHGFTALVDGEVVHGDGSIADSEAGASTAARTMVSLAWQHRASKGFSDEDDEDDDSESKETD